VLKSLKTIQHMLATGFAELRTNLTTLLYPTTRSSTPLVSLQSLSVTPTQQRLIRERCTQPSISSCFFSPSTPTPTASSSTQHFQRLLHSGLTRPVPKTLPRPRRIPFSPPALPSSTSPSNSTTLLESLKPSQRPLPQVPNPLSTPLRGLLTPVHNGISAVHSSAPAHVHDCRRSGPLCHPLEGFPSPSRYIPSLRSDGVLDGD
jgi:hypothetical protein